ncbi:signal transduction histidine kinase [Rivularia sp. PCC 7116]|uniref:ATP-binding response regulator n=1 Tax=Rivularia sp. PCC 7116 TaxID=373994 RepID=UPI00029F1814|nr:hybrid sensor histidine kinase/response regulator [Rivularia sp. PCC 7116]AFY52841.1 signal transduction histidine kinase [Rivularia sp. PCC 7116]
MSIQDSQVLDRILAVDDIPDNLFLVQALLESEGYEVKLVTDGGTAIKEVKKTPPSLILLDVMMPEIDGYEVTRRIRSITDDNYIPILLVTAFDDVSVVEGLDAGADDFIRKPFDTDELLARVRSLLRLKHSIDAQKQMARQREDFVSRLTHDLRTPLVAADRMLNLFLQETFCKISPEMKKAIAAMVRSNNNLLEMVNTLLEVSRFEAGKKTMNFESCSMYSIVEEVVQELSPLAEERDLQLEFKNNLTEESKDKSAVNGDRLELRRVVSNLIGNAIKFTDEGQIEVRLSEFTSNAGEEWVKVDVEDTGYGIAEEDKTTIFERFRSGKNKRSGSGLGLHLSNRIAETHNAKIEFSSELGKGSIFTVVLPKASED